MVVIWPWRMPIASCTTLTTGARQLVVQEAAVSSRCRVGLVELVVDADDDVQRAVVLDRRRDDDALHAALEVAVELLGLQELAGAFEDDVAAEIAPGDVARRGAAALKPEALVADRGWRARPRLRTTVPAAVDAVELQQMRGRRGAALDLVDVHDVEPVAARADRPPARRTPPIAARSASRPMRPMPLMPTRMVVLPHGAVRDGCRRSRRGAPSAPCDRARRTAGSLKISRRRRIMP